MGHQVHESRKIMQYKLLPTMLLPCYNGWHMRLKIIWIILADLLSAINSFDMDVLMQLSCSYKDVCICR